MVNTIVIAIIVFWTVFFTPKIIKLSSAWQTMAATAILAAVLVAIWEAIRPF